MSTAQQPARSSDGNSTGSAVETAAMLAGLSLSEAFRKVVLENPQVIELGKLVAQEDERHQCVFSEGGYPGWHVDYGWSLQLTASELAYDFVKPAVYSIFDSAPEPSEAVRKVSEVIVEKLQALRRMLVKRDLIARGTFEKTGSFELIHALQWERQGVVIDVKSSDLLREIDGKFVVQWSGVALEVPLDTFHVNSAEHDGLRSSPTTSQGRLSPKMASTAAAIEAMWAGKIPAGMAVKDRDTAIVGWQKKNGMAVVTSRTIRRYLETKS